MADLALTTVFTPPASCFDNTYTSVGGNVFVKDVSILSSECYPTSYHSIFSEAIPYSPGVCPSGYSYDQTTSYGNDATAALCCPSGFEAPNPGMGCSSVVAGDTELYADGSTITVDQARLAVHGVSIAWKAGDFQEASTSSSEPTFAPATYSNPVDPSPALRTTSSMPRSTSSSRPAPSSSTSSSSLSTFSSRTISTLISPDIPPSTVTLVTSHSSTSTSTPQPLSTAAKAGIGVGASVAGIAAIAAVGLLLLWRRRKQRKELYEYSPAAMYKEDPEPSTAGKAHHISELSSDGLRSELSGVLPWIEAQSKRGNSGRAELEGQ